MVEKNVKLFEVRTNLPGYWKPTYEKFFVIAYDPTEAQDRVMEFLNVNKIYDSTIREIISITLIAEDTRYPKCGTILIGE